MKDDFPEDDLRPLDKEQLQDVWYRVCRTTLRAELAGDNTSVQHLGLAVGEVRNARSAVLKRTPIWQRQVQKWFAQHPNKIGRKLKFNKDIIGHALAGQRTYTDDDRASRFAQSLLHFYLMGNSFQLPPLPESVNPQFDLVTKIYNYLLRLFGAANGNVPSPMSLAEIVNERERRTFGLRTGKITRARICVSSSRLGFLEHESSSGLSRASQDFLDCGGELILICSKETSPPAMTSAEAFRPALDPSVPSKLPVLYLNPNEERKINGESFRAAEYLSNSWRCVLYRTLYRDDAPEELIFFLQNGKGDALTRLGIDCLEAKDFARWVDVFASPSGTGLASTTKPAAIVA